MSMCMYWNNSQRWMYILDLKMVKGRPKPG